MADPINPNATTTASPEQTQNTDLSDQQLQAPQSQGAQQPMQLQPSAAPASITVPGRAPAAAGSKNTGLHNFVSTVLGALAGEPSKTFTTDSNGRTVQLPAAPMTTGQKLKRLADTIGTGLSTQVPQQKSGLANLLAGAGAGFGAEGQKLSAEEQASRTQARDDFDAEQKNTLHKMELAKGNALLYSTYKHLHDEDIDKNEEYKVNSDISKAFEDEKFPVRRVNGDQLMKEFNETPQQLLTEGRVLLTGERAMVTSDGQSIVDPQTQKPRYERTYAVIDGMHEGSIKAPQSFVDYVNKYAPFATDKKVKTLESLSEGTEIDAKSFYRLHNAALDGLKNVTQGWAKPDAVETKDKDGQIQILERNPISGETRPATDEQKNAYQMNKAKLAAEQSIAPKNKAEQDKFEADAQKAKKDTAAGSASNLTGEDYLTTLPTGRQATVRAVGEGRQVLPANRKEALALLSDVHQAFPDFDETKAKTWQKANNEYRGSGKTAQSLVRANTAMAHAKALYDETTADAVLNPFSKARQDREITLGLLKDEIGAAVKGGVVTQGEGEDLFGRLSGGLTVGAKRERIAEVTRRLHDRIEEQQTKFADSAPSSAVKVPMLISPQAAAAYDYVQSGGKAAQNPQSGQAQNQTPAPTTHSVSLTTAMKNHPGMTEAQVRAWAQQNKYEVTQ